MQAVKVMQQEVLKLELNVQVKIFIFYAKVVLSAKVALPNESVLNYIFLSFYLLIHFFKL